MGYFAVAPWPKFLKVISSLGTGLMLLVGVAAYRAVPVPSGFTHWFGVGVAMVPLAALVGSALFMVRGYTIRDADLSIERLGFFTSVSLSGLSRAWHDPAVCKGSRRVFGNGGLFAFCGVFYRKDLGRYRLFATDLSRAVVLVLPGRVAVVTPADPEGFIAYLQRRFPSVAVGPAD
ncbi:MAG: PH domain-containing protein [Sulfuritalea sp.]|nr:PH domain-containing protein [Sulfuritalea sp.]